MQATTPKMSDIPRNLAADLAESIGAASLDRLAQVHEQGGKALPYVRVAAKCAGMFAREAIQTPELRERAAGLLQRTITVALAEDDAGVAGGKLTSAYLSVMASCAEWLLRMRDAVRREERQVEHSAEAPKPPAPATRTVAAPAPRGPITQRARWLAQQRQKKRSSG